MAIAARLRQREMGRGKQPRGVQSNDPRITAWAGAGLTGPQLAEAYELAVADRTSREDGSPITAGFLHVFVEKMLNPPAAQAGVTIRKPPASDPLAWATTASGITAKGEELGIVQAEAESFPAFAARPRRRAPQRAGQGPAARRLRVNL